MERKLVRQGRDALTVTLPAKWLKDKGLKAGDCVYIEPKDNHLIINSENFAKLKEITIDARSVEEAMIYHLITGKYIDGFDQITILHNNSKIIQTATNKLLGMIITEHTNTRTVIKSIIHSPENNIEIIIRRIGHMLEQQARLLVELTKGLTTLEEIKSQERLLDTNINYCLRHINKYNLESESYKYFLLCSTIELAADIISRIAKDIKKNIKLAETIYKNIELYNKYLLLKDMEKTYYNLRNFRNSIKKEQFIDGLAFELAETLYNNIGYLMDNE